MEHRYDYFHQNPNSIVNGQVAFNRSSTDGTQPTNNYSGSISSTSSQDQSPFHERKLLNSNAVPMNNHLYQMDSSNQPPRSSGPPRTNAKGIYDNSHSSIPNVINLAQTNAENYPNNPDFQLQPHLTSLLPQQSKRVPELYPTENNYSSNRGSIASNMNTNYFSSNKSYPEPKIIEYDMEETSTESSPQHTSSLYSESTDQDSESIQPNNVLSRHTLIKSTECHVTKESKVMTPSSQEFPVPSQFADLILKRDDIAQDHQHSILHGSYQDDDIIEDIPLSDNIDQNESEPILENQEIPESHFREESFNDSRAQKYNYYNKKDFDPTEFNYENKSSLSPAFNNKTNYSYNAISSSSNIENPQLNQELYFSQSNVPTRSSLLNNTIIPPPPQNKPVFPFNTDQESSRIQNYNESIQSGNYNQQTKHTQPIFQDSNFPQIDSKSQCFISNTTNSNTHETNKINQFTSQAQPFNCNESINSKDVKLFNQQNVPTIQSNSHQSISSFSKLSTSELSNDSQLTNSQQFTHFKPSMISTQFVGLPTSAVAAGDSTSRSSSSISEAIVQENQNTPYQTSDDQNSIVNNAVKTSPTNLNNQDLTNSVKSEFDVKLSPSPINNTLENQQELIINQSNNKQLYDLNYSQNNAKSLSPALVNNLSQSNNLLNLNNTTSQSNSNYQPSSTNESTFGVNNKVSSDQLFSNPLSPTSTSNHSASHYFDSISSSHQSNLNQPLTNLQLNSQQQNLSTQDNKFNISSFVPSDKSNNVMTYSNVQSTEVNALSVSQHLPPINKEFEATESLNLNSNKETVTLSSLHSTESTGFKTNVSNDEPLKHSKTETIYTQESSNVTPNEQFSNMVIDNKKNIPVSQTNNHEQKSVSYFSKETLLNKEENLNEVNNLTSNLYGINNSTQELMKDDLSLSAISKESNSNQAIIHQNPEFEMRNKIDSSDKANMHVGANQYVSSQQLNDNKVTSNVVPPISSVTNQLPPKIMNPNLQTSNVLSPFSPTPSQYPTHSISNQFTQNVSSVSNTLPKSDFTPLQSTPNQHTSQLFNPSTSTVAPVSSAVNQLPLQMFNNQLKSDAVQTFQSTQQFNNQQIPNVVPPVTMSFNQLPPQMLNYKPNSSTTPLPESVSSQCSTQPFNNQPTSTMITSATSTVTALPPQMLSNTSKSDAMPPLLNKTNQYPPKTVNNQSTLNVVQPSPSNIDHFSTQSNDLTKTEIISPIQQSSGFPVHSMYSHSTQNSVPLTSSTTNQLPPQNLGILPKSDNIPPLQAATNSAQTFKNQPTMNLVSPVPSTVNPVPPQMFNNQPKADVPYLQTTPSQYPSQPFNNQLKSNMVPPVPSSTNQHTPQMFSNQPQSNVVPPLQPTLNQYPSQPFNNQPKSNMVPPIPSAVNQFSQQMLNNPGFNAYPSNKLTNNQYPSKPLSNQLISNVPSVQQTMQYAPQPFNNQPKSNTFPSSQSVTNKYPSQPLGSQFSNQQVLPNQPPANNQFYNQTDAARPNQWPRSNTNQSFQSATIPPLSSKQTSPMLAQQNPMSAPLNVNQPTQRINSQMLPPNPSSTNNYYNQVHGNRNNQQSQPLPLLPGQNVQSVSRGHQQQSNMGFPNQTNYQQPSLNYGQQAFHNQSQDPYRSEPNPSIVQQGFAKTWGHDNLDLLKSRDVLPGDGVQPPEIKLPQGYANCDNCSPDIFRCTLNKFPSSKNLLDKSRLPLGILIHPYKDLSCLTVIQCETITRCRNCRSYINPFVQFIDNAHWKCNLCYRVNELPGEFQIDPYTKTLGDPSRRPEILNATIEYIASQDYMVRPPQPALYLFLLDVSRTATLTGYLEIVCDRILNKIMGDSIPGDSRTNIGFITFDSAVHFYQIANSDGGQPKQLIVSDISDIFLPLPDGLMVNLEENKSAIKDLLISLPNQYRESYNTGCALGAALQAAFKILAPRGGRVTVFQASLPNIGPGSLQSRDDGNPHTGDRVQHMTPSTDFYKKLALECSAEQIAVDLFFVSSQYLDIATVSGISKYSAGCIHNFPQFDVKSPTIVTRFINCFDRYLSRKIGFEALLRLRCTRGVSIHSFHGNFFVRSSDLLMLPNVNPDNAYGMQLSIEDSLEGVSVVCFQAALLYTSSNAERRIRVHTLCIPVTDNLNDIFHNADQQAITCLIAKMAVDRSTEKSLSDAREAFFNAISDSLSAFKLGCSSYNGPGTMLSPVSLKVFPLYILATLKHAAFRTNQPTRLDERMFSMCQMKSLPLTNLIQYIYPDLYPIHSLEEQPKINYEKLTEIPLPPVLQLSAERVESNGIYLMDDSETLTIFVGHRSSDQLIQKLFGYINVNAMPELITTLIEVDSKPSYLLRSFISYLQHMKSYPLPIEIIKDNGPHKLRFYSRLIEDKFESSLSYYEFLQRLSQQVR